jgi:isoquinoline 1-oxidoreductase alpha subunit
MATNISFTLNGKSVTVAVPAPDMPLLWVLRDLLGLTGTKYGCGEEKCGACTVLVNGQREHSCVYNVSNLSAGSQVLTIEGADTTTKTGDATLQSVQKAWIDNQVPQCGYCQPGMIMVAAGSVKAGHHGSEIASDITHVCVCGTYPRIKNAIQSL